MRDQDTGTTDEPEDRGVEEAPAPAPAPRRRLRDSPVGTVAVIVVVGLLVVLGVWLVDGGGPDAAAEPEPGSSGGVSAVELTSTEGVAPEEGQPAPDFTTFALDGSDVILSEMQGKPVWLVFGATWCANCRAETPDIQTVQEAYGDDVEIVAVYVGETISTVGDYADRLGLTYRQVADSYTDIGSAYRVLGLPTHVFVDADGVVSAIDVGTVTEQAAAERLDAMLDR